VNNDVPENNENNFEYRPFWRNNPGRYAKYTGMDPFGRHYLLRQGGIMVNEKPGKEKIPLPGLVSWNITSRCHLNCPHCYIDAGEESPGVLSTYEAISLVDDLVNAGTKVLILSGGEPLLRQDIYEIARYGSDKGLRIAIGTSGTLIDKTVAGKLRESGVSSVAISLDSAVFSVHDRFRGVPGAWRDAIAGIRECDDAGLQVQMNITISPDGPDNLDPLICLGEELGIRNFQVFFIVPVGRGSDLPVPDPVLYENAIRGVLEKLKGSDLNIRPTCAPQFMRIAREMGVSRPEWRKGCIAGTSYCRICPDGDVTPCPYLPVVAGNVRKTSFANIWSESPIFNALREPSAIQGKCGRCEYTGICGGCRARAFGVPGPSKNGCGRFSKTAPQNGNYLGEDPLCIYMPSGSVIE
jgi:AdoMet-dependent heme synthase